MGRQPGHEQSVAAAPLIELKSTNKALPDPDGVEFRKTRLIFTKGSSMLAQQSILEAAQRAASAASSPARVILFGSYARGDADDGSDLDLLVIERNVPDKAAEYLKLHRAIGPMGVGVDVVVLSHDEFRRRSQVPGTLPYWAAREGTLRHDAGA